MFARPPRVEPAAHSLRARPGRSVSVVALALGIGSLVLFAAAAPARAQAPTITNVIPPTGPTTGGMRVTVVGANFGGSGGTVTMQGRSVSVPSGADWAPSRVIFTTPAGDPGPAPVQVQRADGALSNLYGSPFYQPPTLTGVSPAGGPAAGGVVVTLTGANFGTTGATGVARFGVAEVPLVPVSHFEAQAIAPALAPGMVFPVSLVINGQASSGSQTYATLAPRIDDFQPRTAATPGGTVITIVGDNFGTAADPVPVVKFGGIESPAVARPGPNEIHAVAPPGAGSGLLVEVHVGPAMRAPAASPFDYLPPVLADLVPPTGPAAAGVRLTIMGANFGPAGTERSLDLQPLGGGLVIHGDLNGPEDHGRIEADLPPLAPGVYATRLWVAGQPSNVVVYEATGMPVVTGVSPSVVPTQGGVLVTITGSNFGVDGGVVRVQGRDVPIPAGPAWTPTAIEFDAPEGDPGPAPIEAHPLFGPGSKPFDGMRYPPPSLSSLSPPDGPAAGGTVITLHGLNFGTEAAARVARMGGKIALCTRLSHSELEVVAPNLPPGQAVPVELVINGEPANVLTFQVDPPQVASYFPPTGPTMGGVPITIFGANFGAAPDDPEPIVRVGANPAADVVRAGPGELSFALPPGAGLDRPITVEVGGVVSAPAVPPFDYDPPQVSDLAPTSAPAAGGVLLTILGTNFGPPGTPRHVHVVDALGSFVDLPVPNGQAGQHFVQVTAPPVAPGVCSVTLDIDGQLTLAGTYEAVSSGAPIVLALSSQLGPTQGNVPITIIGQDFGPAPGLVYFGPFPAAIDTWAPGEIRAFTPEAWSGPFPVTVERADGQAGPPGPVYVYAAPTIQSVLPALLDPAGGQVITIAGQNFGRADAPRQVLVGGQPATPLGWLGHGLLLVQSPPGPANALVPLCVQVAGAAEACLDVPYGNPVGVAPPVVPVAFGLRLAGPNPARGEAVFAVDLPRDARWGLRLFDSAGRQVRSYAADGAAGTRLLRWDGTDARGTRTPAGLYWARLEVAGETFVRKVMRL